MNWKFFLRHNPAGAVMAGTLLAVACNRNSNELPPASDAPAQYVQDVLANGIAVARIIVLHQRLTTQGSDTVYVLAQSLDSAAEQTPDSLRMLLEGCATGEGSYSTCPLLREFTIDLRTTKTDTVLKLTNPGILPSASTFRFGLLRQFGNPARISNHPLAGLYAAAGSYANAIRDTVVRYTARARGYVLADGQAVVRLRANDTAEYNITGRYLPASLVFEGLVGAKGVVQSPVTYDSVRIGGSATRLPADTTRGGIRDSLRLQRALLDGVNHFDLYLKK